MRMTRSRVLTLGAAFALSGPAPQALAAEVSEALQTLLDYVRDQKTTGFLVIQDGKVVVERNWPAPPGAAAFKAFAYETNADGALLEDVASQQKSFVAMLAAIAVDKGVLDVEKPVSAYLGGGWSRASPEQESKIRVLDLLTMSSGLDTAFGYAAPPGTTFLYNTPVYAVIKQVIAAAAQQSLEAVTAAWLTGPAGMSNTSWRERPAALGDVGNPTGLVTSPRDVARIGQIVLDRGRCADGRPIISEAGLRAMFAPSAANPSYGWLWWLNGAPYAVRPPARRVSGPLIPSAPPDLVAALGALDRKLYISPSRRLVVVRLGQAAPDQDFDDTLWRKLGEALR